MNLHPTFTILKKLSESKIKYVVIGGVAAVLYGVIRLTVDVDIVLEFSLENVNKFVSFLKELNLRPLIPINPSDLSNHRKREEWIQEKHAKVINFTNPDGTLKLDVALIYNYQEIEKNIIEVEGVKVPLISKEMFISMKREAGRPIDLNDIEKLEGNW